MCTHTASYFLLTDRFMNLLVEPTYDKTHKFNTSKVQRTKQTRLFTNTSFLFAFPPIGSPRHCPLPLLFRQQSSTKNLNKTPFLLNCNISRHTFTYNPQKIGYICKLKGSGLALPLASLGCERKVRAAKDIPLLKMEAVGDNG